MMDVEADMAVNLARCSDRMQQLADIQNMNRQLHLIVSVVHVNRDN